MGSRLTGWLSLTWRERAILLGCAAGLVCLHVGLRLFGYSRTRRAVEALTRSPSGHAASEAELVHAQAMARLAAIAGRHSIFDASCLRQSLLLYGWLRRRGLRPELRLGIADSRQEAFRAHAWVELEGSRLLAIDAQHRPFITQGPSG